MTGTIYVCDERPGGGVSAIPLNRVKGATGLKVVRGERVERYPFRGQPSVTAKKPSGDPIITLLIDEQGETSWEFPLAGWPRAVALLTTDTLFWLRHGRWVAAPGQSSVGQALSVVEAYCYPDGYKLPPTIQSD
jgi:hypothetical protein